MNALPIVAVVGAVGALGLLALSGGDADAGGGGSKPGGGTDPGGGTGPSRDGAWVPGSEYGGGELAVFRKKHPKAATNILRSRNSVTSAELEAATEDFCRDPRRISTDTIATIILSVGLAGYASGGTDVSRITEEGTNAAARAISRMCATAKPGTADTARLLGRASGAVLTSGVFDEVGRHQAYVIACEGQRLDVQQLITLVVDYGVRALRRGWTYQNIVVSLPSKSTCSDPGGKPPRNLKRAQDLASAVAEAAVRIRNGFA